MDIVDHTNAENLQESLCLTSWENRVATSSSIATSCCIYDLINHLFKESQAVFSRTKYEDDWYIYHNVLFLLTSQNSVDYTCEMNYLPHLIFLINELNDVINKNTSYFNMVVGNHFKMMPLDAHLNQDLHKTVDLHASISKALPDNDQFKFSKTKPKAMSSAYLHLWDPSLGLNTGSPTSGRICQDISGVINKHIF